MKLANLSWVNTDIGNMTKAVNFGDFLQIDAIEYLLKEYFTQQKIERLSIKELTSYKGEKLVLPINGSLFYENFMYEDKINISSDIYPVFLAVTTESTFFKEEYMNEYNIKYLQRFEPIGCRDEDTKNLLIKYGIKAYLNGCMTQIFPYKGIKGKKVLFIDVPEEVKSYYKKNSDEVEFFTQQEYFNSSFSIEDIHKMVKDRYEYYLNNAKLIVTSRLHVLLPSMAAGIPVVFTKNVIDGRFHWIKNYIQLYDQSNYSDIDWKGKTVLYEEKKQKIIELAITRINNALNNIHEPINFSEVDDLFEKDKNEYVHFKSLITNNYEKVKEYLKTKYMPASAFNYTIWGIGNSAESVYQYICKEYVNAKLVCALDTYKSGEFHGVKIINPMLYERKHEEIVIAVPVQVSNIAYDFLINKGFNRTDIVCASDIFMKQIE